MAGDARSGLKLDNDTLYQNYYRGLNGWGCPFGFETSRS